MATLDARVTVRLERLTVDAGLTADGPLALVGPSGAGKTTLLRAIAGLRRPEAGHVTVDGATWFDAATGTDLPPERRSVGFVFQEYALFPHLDVEANVAFGGRERARDLLRRFGIGPLARVRPADLSGGERQRVALARALARDPAVLLLDEPLAALDAHTRAHVRGELAALLAGLERPAIVVTHDFGDAAALADRIAVMGDGRIVQTGPPTELLDRPASPFVAALAGTNLVVGEATPLAGGRTRIEIPGGRLDVGGRYTGRVGVAMHPWEIAPAPAGDGASGPGLTGRVGGLVRAGDRVRLTIGPVAVETDAAEVGRLGLRPGDEAAATIDPETVRVVPQTTA